LPLFAAAGMEALRAKSQCLTDYLLFLLDRTPGRFTVLTPRNAEERGCQVSLRVHGDGPATLRRLQAAGVMADFRPPDVIRVAPVPLWNRWGEGKDLAAIRGEGRE